MKKPAILILLFNIVFTQGYVRDVSPFTVTFDGEEIFQPFTGGLNQPDPCFIDWNGDGTLDCFINDRDGYLQYWEGVADWQFGNIPLFTFVTKTFQNINVGTWFTFHDFDGDGDEDLLSHTPDSDNVSYWSNENGEFELVADELLDIDNLPVYGGQIVIPAIADIDGDGHIDYFIGDISGRLAYYKGYGMSAGLPLFELITSTFEDIQIVWTPSRHGANAVEFYDMDNDNDLDLIWGDFYQPG
ncbi:MAG: VCBS repeat-containing protein, partial [Candidatus Marinimicrobia bacterium]|nr:VCBS repeat-containing protein [Candidatus Neomarinimicrobiota bacterium]